MNCLGCYKENTEGYCLKCRKKLFDGKQVPAVLPFASPQNNNAREYREQTKRLSISGVQLKYSLKREEKELMLTEDGGQYILKPIPPSMTIVNPGQAPENERLTMQIAAQVFNIETAANALIYFNDGEPAYLTRRFDISATGKHLQEDFAQLSGRSKKGDGDNFKYNGTYEDIGLLIKKYVAAYAPAMEAFFRIILFNYLVSNGDAHLKNFSLLQAATGEYKLSPAYDLMSTLIHVPGETDTALDLFEGDDKTAYYETYGHHGYPDFMELARRIYIIEPRAKRIITEMCGKNDQVVQMINASLLSEVVKAGYRNSFLEKVSRIKF